MRVMIIIFFLFQENNLAWLNRYASEKFIIFFINKKKGSYFIGGRTLFSVERLIFIVLKLTLSRGNTSFFSQNKPILCID